MANLSTAQIRQIEQSLPDLHQHLAGQLAAIHADDLGLAFLVLSSSKSPIFNLRAVLNTIKTREARVSGFVSLDEVKEEAAPLHEILEAPTEEEIEAARAAVFDEATEATLNTASLPARTLGKLAGCCIRTAKSKRKKLLDEYAGRTRQQPLFAAKVVRRAE
jgi:hypothetical protein